MEWAQVLVIILSVTLAVFLLFSIVLVIMLIRVTRQIQAVTGAAERTAKRFESVASEVASFMSAKAIMRAVTSFINKKDKK